jgi:hypothetical protein
MARSSGMTRIIACVGGLTIGRGELDTPSLLLLLLFPQRNPGKTVVGDIDVRQHTFLVLVFVIVLFERLRSCAKNNSILVMQY